MTRHALLALALTAAACGSGGVRVGADAPAPSRTNYSDGCTAQDVVDGTCIGGCTASIPPICSYWRLQGASGLVGTLLPPPEPVVVTAPLLPPDGAVILYYADQRCPPSVPTAKLPVKASRECYAIRSRLALIQILKREKVSPGVKSPCYSYRDPGVYANCLDVAARSLPDQAYGLSGLYVNGTLYGQPWSGCAAGATYADFVFASLAEPARVLPLVAHESANHFMKHVYDQPLRTDGPLVSEAASAAKAACGE